jgi:tetratricopeptide (TPR) repeat protein/SAM-dependent methyltransferase
MSLAANLQQRFDAALALHRAGDMQAAARAYRAILESHPQQPDALNLLALVEMEGGRHRTAVDLLRRAISVSPQVPQFHCHLGNALQTGGDFAAAATAYRNALAMQPQSPEAHTGLGFALSQLGRASEAVEHLNEALRADPEHFVALNNLGDVLGEQGDLDGAQDAYRRAIALEPGVAELRTKLGAVLRALGRPAEAVEQLWAAIDRGDDDLTAHRLLGSLLRISAPSAYDRHLEQRLLAYFATPGVDHGDVAEFATALLKLKYADDPRLQAGSKHAFVFDTLLADPLAGAVLTGSVNGDEDLERLLTDARRQLLLGGVDMDETTMPAMSVLAQQCFNNEYVFAVSEQERVRLETLVAALASHADWSTAPEIDVQRSLLLLGMYQPLGTLPMAARLADIPLDAWHATLRPMVRCSLLEPLEEVALEVEIAVLGGIDDPVSRAVLAQYQENPYPRWLTPAYRNPASVYRIAQSMFPDFEPPVVLKGPVRVLVVGCGTGRHAISIALRYANAEVLATDLSRRSLAFGLRMARRLGVGNVRFVENDLLNVGEIDGEFHIVECVGVLHHMRSIAQGLHMLVTKLHADGLLKLGLYSEQARQPVLAAREKIAALGLGTEPDDVRRFRQLVLSAPQDDPLRRILGFGDFYTLSNCRDLLFHVHEQNVTLDDIRDLLAEANLRFMGFESADAALADAYRRRYPQDRAMRDLSRWQALQEARPEAFPTLYQFWCMRGGPG